MNNQIAIGVSDFQKYGCISCGCVFVHSNMSGQGASPVTCRDCNSKFVLLADGLTICPMGFGTSTLDVEEVYYPILVEHPRKGLWPHEFVRPDIRPKGIDGEFWESRGVGYDLAGFVKTKASGERIVDMIKEIVYRAGGNAKSWLDYRPSEPLWIQVKIQKEDGFDLEALRKLCEDGVINKERLNSARIIKLSEEVRATVILAERGYQ